MIVIKTYEGFLYKERESFRNISNSYIANIVILLQNSKLKIKHSLKDATCDVFIYNNESLIFEIDFYQNQADTIIYTFYDNISLKSFTFYDKNSSYNYINNILKKLENKDYIVNLLEVYINKNKINKINNLPIDTNMYDFITEYLLNKDSKYIHYIDFNKCSKEIIKKYSYLKDANNFDLI